jgi:hypothetical protein
MNRGVLIAGISLCGCAVHAQTMLDESPQEKALSASVFATPAPAPAEVIPKALRSRYMHLSGVIIQKLGEGAYFIRPDVGCAAQLGIPIVAISGSGASALYQSQMVLLRGEPTTQSGNLVACLVQRGTPYKYSPSDGKFVQIATFTTMQSATPTPAPTKMQAIFGPDTQMRGSTLDR